MDRYNQNNVILPAPSKLADWRQEAIDVWRDNIQDDLIKPSHEIYGANGNTWGYAWDTALAAETIATVDPLAAGKLVNTYLSCQHVTGRIPHMIMRADSFPVGVMATNINWHGWRQSGRDKNGYRYKSSPITQPPLLAVAAASVADNLQEEEHRFKFARNATKHLVKYHSWLYRTRELNGDGLIAMIHPHETGRDDAPSHVELLKQVPLGWRERLWLSNASRQLFEANRLDKTADPESRSATEIVMRAAALAIFRLKPFSKHDDLVPKTHPYQHFDVGFNSILDRANDELKRIAAIGRLTLPAKLLQAMDRTAEGLQKFWDPSAKAFRGIDALGKADFPAGREIGDLLPLYSSHITEFQAKSITNLLKDPLRYGGEQLPSVSRDCSDYNADAFWGGSSWPPIYKLLISGAERGPLPSCQQLAPKLARDVLAATANYADNKFPEYRDAESGEPKGAKNFTWAATLLIKAIDNYENDSLLDAAV